MRYEGDANYASDPYGTPPQRGGRRGLLGLGLAVVGIVAFAGAIVVVYGGKGQSTPDGGPPLLMADSAPTKARPEQPGGMEVPHQDKLVYERLNDRGSKSQIERLLPPPEEPLPRPVVAPQVPPSPTLPEAPAVAQLPPPPPGSTTTVPRQEGEGALPPAAAPAPPPAVAALPAPAPAAPAPKAAPPPAAKPAPAPPAAAPKPQPTPPVAAAPPPQPAPAPAKASGGGAWRVQLAAVRSEAEASTEWKRLTSRYGAALGGLSMQVAKADLGEKGIFYRIQGVGLDEERAKSVCAQLKSQNVGCVVVRP
ncbi:SPOR domain-containing protein [Azospirillum brasilense]|uniref:SPOR domain-containing protein n=2 Tax=Azospirillum brasilense TaxID=192 RepID=UPI000E6A5442|nr:SPOR domain-containing protein [Azospirillum brasilense]NUB30155.1 SPOR domain-containing protein [Azospirillum brasilense]RIW05009.1 SPOR domain-containing protein [Azospirillum brasilense]